MGRAVSTYEIRTLKSRGRPSLFAVGEYANDLDAITEARTFMRPGETVEVWRDANLVYRVAPGGIVVR